jgi:hypothetical protein
VKRFPAPSIWKLTRVSVMSLSVEQAAEAGEVHRQAVPIRGADGRFSLRLGSPVWTT